MTKRQRDTYIKNLGQYCPHCESQDISGIPGFDFGMNQVWQTVECKACKKKWVDIYTLTDAEDDDTVKIDDYVCNLMHRPDK